MTKAELFRELLRLKDACYYEAMRLNNKAKTAPRAKAWSKLGGELEDLAKAVYGKEALEHPPEESPLFQG